MRYAILSDIHANLEALEESLAYLSRERIDEYWIPGDIVNYGADPNACMEIAMRVGPKIIAGNHERALFDEVLASCFNPYALQALRWTRKELEPKWLEILRNLPLLCSERLFTMGHAAIACPEKFDYLYHFEDAGDSLRMLKTPVGWIGHTHIPRVFRKTEGSAFSLRAGKYPLDRDEMYLINAGSVGQPRDSDPRLSLAVFDDEEYVLELVRLPYNNRKAAEKILAAGLPRYLADRLL